MSSLKNIGIDGDDCRLRLQSYLEEIESLMDLLSDPDSMNDEQVRRARTQLDNLKSCLKMDCKYRNTLEGSSEMSEVESAVFFPAVYQSYVDLNVSVRSRPSREWFSELYAIRVNINFALDNLNNWQAV